MRVMVMMRASKSTEAGELPSTDMLNEMGKFNEQIVRAGILLSGEGLHGSAKGKRVHFEGGKTRVIDGPFTETKELIAGFWLWQVKSMEEAVEWAKRIPQFKGKEQEVELRQVFDIEDFGAAVTPEVKERDDRLRAEVAGRS